MPRPLPGLAQAPLGPQAQLVDLPASTPGQLAAPYPGEALAASWVTPWGQLNSTAWLLGWDVELATSR